MKKFPILLSALLLTTISSPALAKKNKQQKAEIKEWQQRKDALQPWQLKDLVEENHRLKTGNQQLAEEVKLTKEELAQLLKLKVKIDALRKQRGIQGKASAADRVMGEAGSDNLQAGSTLEAEDYADLEALFSPQQPNAAESQAGSNVYVAQGMAGPDGFSKDDWAVGAKGEYYLKGLIFKVQIGAYRQLDLRDVLEGEKLQEAFEQEQSEGINLYTLMHFRNYGKANKFKKELRAMGLKDAWIVAFRDGKRVPLKAVLQEVLQQQ